jgi:hypothetical protein
MILRPKIVWLELDGEAPAAWHLDGHGVATVGVQRADDRADEAVELGLLVQAVQLYQVTHAATPANVLVQSPRSAGADWAAIQLGLAESAGCGFVKELCAVRTNASSPWVRVRSAHGIRPQFERFQRIENLTKVGIFGQFSCDCADLSGFVAAECCAQDAASLIDPLHSVQITGRHAAWKHFRLYEGCSHYAPRRESPQFVMFKLDFWRRSSSRVITEDNFVHSRVIVRIFLVRPYRHHCHSTPRRGWRIPNVIGGDRLKDFTDFVLPVHLSIFSELRPIIGLLAGWRSRLEHKLG